MIVDHIGLFFFPQIFALRVIGRIAFPIFAFFIAEGYFHTHSKTRYFSLLLLFAIISQVPYAFLFGYLRLNVLFTFVFAFVFLLLIDKIKQNKKDWVLPVVWIVTLSIFAILLTSFYSYGFLGILCVVLFYIFRNNQAIKWSLFCVLMIFMALFDAISLNLFTIKSCFQVFGILALPFLLLYNGEKGKINLKYLFYVFYPAHLFIILIILNLI